MRPLTLSLTKPRNLRGFAFAYVQSLPVESGRKVSHAVSQMSAAGALTHNWLTHMLTDTKIRTLKPRATAYRVADTNGLCIEVRPSGAKAW